MAWCSSRFRDLDPEGKGGEEYSYRNRGHQSGNPDFDGLPSVANQGHGNRHRHLRSWVVEEELEDYPVRVVVVKTIELHPFRAPAQK